MCGGGDNDKYKDKDFQDPTYEGEPTDEKFAEGPLEDRHCTDILCCFIFIAFWFLMAYIAQIGYTNGYLTNNY